MRHNLAAVPSGLAARQHANSSSSSSAQLATVSSHVASANLPACCCSLISTELLAPPARGMSVLTRTWSSLFLLPEGHTGSNSVNAITLVAALLAAPALPCPTEVLPPDDTTGSVTSTFGMEDRSTSTLAAAACAAASCASVSASLAGPGSAPGAAAVAAPAAAPVEGAAAALLAVVAALAAGLGGVVGLALAPAVAFGVVVVVGVGFVAAAVPPLPAAAAVLIFGMLARSIGMSAAPADGAGAPAKHNVCTGAWVHAMHRCK
jgi:hypothetical protein